MSIPKLFLDSNIWLRFFLKDNEQYPEVVEFLKYINDNQVRAYTSAIVLMEISYILTKRYHRPITKVHQCLDMIVTTPHLGVIEFTNYQAALELYQTTKIKLGDCFIATQLPEDATLVTYDKDFNKIKNLKTITPGQFLKKYAPESTINLKNYISNHRPKK
jgi:predicted nucleic acid-binding protein